VLVKIENESKFFLQSFVLAVLCFFLNDFVFFEKDVSSLFSIFIIAYSIYAITVRNYNNIYKLLLFMFFLLATRPRSLHLISLEDRGNFLYYSPNILKLFGPSVSTSLCFIFLICVSIRYLIANRWQLDIKVVVICMFLFTTLINTLIYSIFFSQELNLSYFLTDIKYLLFLILGVFVCFCSKLSIEKIVKDFIFISLTLGFMFSFFLLRDVIENNLLLMYNHSTYISCIGVGLFICCAQVSHSWKFPFLIVILLGSVPITRGEQLIFIFMFITSFFYVSFIHRRPSSLFYFFIMFSFLALSLVLILSTDNALSQLILRKFDFFVSGNLQHDKSSSIRVLEIISILNDHNLYKVIFGSGFGGTFELPYSTLKTLDLADFPISQLQSNSFLHPHFFLGDWLLKFGVIGTLVFSAIHIDSAVRYRGAFIIFILFLPTLLWQAYWSPGYALLCGLMFGLSYKNSQNKWFLIHKLERN